MNNLKLPFPVINDDENYFVVEYEKNGDLYLVKNTKKITVNFEDIVVVTYTPQDDNDQHLPYSIAKVVSFFNKYSLEVATALGINLDLDKICFQDEDIIYNITNPEGGNDDAQIIICGITPKDIGDDGNPDSSEIENPTSLEDIMEKPSPKEIRENNKKKSDKIERVKETENIVFKRFIRIKKTR